MPASELRPQAAAAAQPQPPHQPSDYEREEEEFVWTQIKVEARRDAESEPALVSYLYWTVLYHSSLAGSLSFHLANKLCFSTLLHDLVLNFFSSDHALRAATVADLRAARARDPACVSFSHCLLYYKGFLACQAQRVAHKLWNQSRRPLALALQSQISNVFAVDIHPAAKIGKGVLFDHATGVVVGETAVIGNNVSILHHVTLGGSGKAGGDRHPKIEDGVLIGAGATILGNVKIGEGANIMAGSVVPINVPPRTTAVGNPARLVGGEEKPKKHEEVPGESMDHTSFISEWSVIEDDDAMNMHSWGYFEPSCKGHPALQLLSTMKDTKPILLRHDSTNLVAPNGAYHPRDSVVSDTLLQYNYARDSGMNPGEKFFNMSPPNHNNDVLPESSGAYDMQMLQVPDSSRDDRIGRIEEPSPGVEKENPQPKKRQSNGIPKSPKAKKSKKPKDNTSPPIQRAKLPKKSMDVVINGIDMDISSIPIPVCSCTGAPRQCYRWGCGGWQSACCTTQVSMYPLPMSTKRGGARTAGRKMSQGAFKKVLEKLAAEGYNFANPIDLRTHWAKHGTNKFVIIR